MLGAMVSLALTYSETAEATYRFQTNKTFKVDCDSVAVDGHHYFSRKFTTIQKAVDRARSGTIIEVTGTCQENVEITTDGIHLKSLGAGIHGQSNAYAIRIAGSNVRVTGFEISSNGSGVLVTDRGSATIGGPEPTDRNTFKDTVRATAPPFRPSGTAIAISNNAYAVIENNEFGIAGGMIQGNAITIVDTAAARIIGNTINEQVARHGIFAYFASVITEGNVIKGIGRNGIFAQNTSIEIVDDTIEGTGGAGVTLLRSNAIIDGVSVTETGNPHINVFNGSGVQFVDVTVTGPESRTGTGINVGGSSSAQFARTEVTSHATGVFIFGRSSGDFVRGFPPGGNNKIYNNSGDGLFVSSSHVTLNNSGTDEIKDNEGLGIVCNQLGSLSVLQPLTISGNNGVGPEVFTGSATDCSVFDTPAPLPVGDVP